MPSVPSLGATVGASTGHQAATSLCALEAIYLNSATAERGVAIKARGPGDEDGMRTLVVDADFSWWGGERCERHTHSHKPQGSQRPDRHSDTMPVSV